MREIPAPLLVVTDRHQAQRPLSEVVSDVVEAGARWIWLRDRDLDPAARRSLALELKALCNKAFLSVGGDIELAAEISAAGVHLQTAGAIAAARQKLGAALLIGVSAHHVGEVRAAAEAGANYVTLSPIFPSASKPGYGPALGLAAITEAARCGIPIIALGGISAARIGACQRAGAAGVAMMGTIMRAPDPAALVMDILARLAAPQDFPHKGEGESYSRGR